MIFCILDLTQIIGMSATLSNIEDLANFLDADIYKNNFRPVALDEFVKCEESLYKVDSKSNPDDGLDLERVINCRVSVDAYLIRCRRRSNFVF